MRLQLILGRGVQFHRPIAVRPLSAFRSPQIIIRAASTAPARKLDLLAIDRKWKTKWQTRAGPKFSDAPPTAREKAYVLPMFPYPSGTLHMGHVRVYTISDVLARFKRMKGYDVLHPMGWDAFGLPAENAAIERGINPADWTEENIAKMKEQLKALGTEFDWDRRLFLMLHEKGLAYQAKAMVNYDPVDKTVLANEQVDANGCSWRSGAKVEKRELKQWFFRITAFKEALLKDLDSLADGWPERILSMQRHWLGKSVGARLTFKIITPDENLHVQVFTTRADTLPGVHYIALSIDHPLVTKLAKADAELKAFVGSASSFPPDSKDGYRLSTVEAVNPLCAIESHPGIPAHLPVFVAPYVLGDYGEGAVMGVPGHDSRDFAFWAKNMPSAPIVSVIEPERKSGALEEQSHLNSEPFVGEGYLNSLCGKFAGLSSKEAREAIVSSLRDRNGSADFTESWRLRDWLISRQRYWGAPIPIIHCDDCGAVPVPVDQLPVELPVIDRGMKNKAGNPLESAENWLNTVCPSCQKPAKRDTDTMDTFVDSSWYFLRFLDPSNKTIPFSPSLARPVDIYIGGIEHAILHLLYSRFIYKFLATSGMVPDSLQGKSDGAEPFLTLLSQGMVHGKTFSDPATGRFLRPSEVDLSDAGSPVLTGTKIAPNVSFEKMSKSKYNGVDPSLCIEKYGADATRAHILFAAPVSEVLEWDEAKIVGVQRWFSRLWKVTCDLQTFLASEPGLNLADANGLALPPLDRLSDKEAELLLLAHSTISSVTTCLEKNPYALNTAISDLTKLTNAISTSPLCPTASSSASRTVSYIIVSSLLRLLAPIAPAFSSECWEVLHASVWTNHEAEFSPSVLSSPWPKPLLSDAQVDALQKRGAQTIAVQVNGKTRFTATISRFSPGSAELSPLSQREGEGRRKDAMSEEEQSWILSRILETDKGKLWLTERNEWEKRKRVVVVGGGKVVNVVF
ncbi:leucyl-tRNA synthetase [Uncinocarpus reesii 1704]|uniref:leucine--tRNA ligase n=1 Tax=Uncinocarpus reesii (strain UAMH 1704) TaxID=336963 RepID=C4JP45_UNCRE|nr:leucyl-tRNA synthetase [Uncinocarpus reesii 1704]EEP78259.1 leucyl-tRNA synthetase [Uncinocarpus reesii 1704]